MASILYIEDEEFFSGVLAQKIHEKGMDISVAGNAEQGWELVKEKHFDMILLDLVLPGMSGFDFLQQIKADPATKDISVIVLSNLGSETDKEKAKHLGAELFLVKMLNTPAQIISVIESQLEKSKISESH